MSPGEHADGEAVEDEGRHLAGVELGSEAGRGHRGGQLRELLEEGGQHRAEADSHEAAAQEPLHRLLGAEHDEGRGAAEEAAHVGRDVVEGDDGHGEDVPDHPVLQRQIQQVARTHQVEHRQVAPTWDQDEKEILLLSLLSGVQIFQREFAKFFGSPVVSSSVLT